MLQGMGGIGTGVRAICVEVEGALTRVPLWHDTFGIEAGMVPLGDGHRYSFLNTLNPSYGDLAWLLFLTCKKFCGRT